MIHARRSAPVFIALMWSVVASAAPLELNPGEHICIIGNTLAERLQLWGWTETMLHARFPRHELVVRNLGYSGDELTLRLRSKNFGTPDEWLSGVGEPIGGFNHNRFALTDTKADAVFAFFGYNESFAGEPGLEKFKADLDAFITATLSMKYNGKSAPKLVIFSPIAHENLHNPDLPDGSAGNARLKLYTQAMAEVSGKHPVVFVDLFTPTLEGYAGSTQPWTLNGIHLVEHGDKQLAQIIDRALFGEAGRPDPARLAKLNDLVAEKNFRWFNRYRVTDGYSTYGDRAFLMFHTSSPRQLRDPSAADKAGLLPMNYETLQRELEVLDIQTSARDRAIWSAAAGGDGRIEEPKLPPYIDARTNLPGTGPNGEHVYFGGEEAISHMTLAPGLKVNLYASEERFPDLVNPVQMAWDTRGRLWVATWASYPHWRPTDPMNDKLLILEDTDGDGRADRAKTFADGLHNPTGFEFYNSGVIVAVGPNIVFLRDTDGDDQADVKITLLHGLDTADTHHTANSFTFDPAGALYFQEGTFHHTQVETPWGPTLRNANGGVYRFEPRTFKFDAYVSYGFANPHGHVFDRWGTDIVIDGTGAVPYFGPSFSGHVAYPAKHPGGAPVVYKQRTRPCPGAELLTSRHFPDDWQGDLLVPNVIGFQGILHYKLKPEGAGLSGTEVEPILSSDDPRFRPADVEMGPDGAIYFTDWQNPVIGHMQHNLRDTSRDKTHGRVYRVTYEGRRLLTPPKIAGQPVEKLLDLLKEPENRTRYQAKIELSGRPREQVIGALRKWIASLSKGEADYEHHLTEALWVYSWNNVVNEELLRQLLGAKDYHARAAAVRVLCYWRDRVKDPVSLLAKAADDREPRVRLEAVRALSFIPEPRAAEAALIAMKHPVDDFIAYTMKQTMKTLEPQWKAAIAAGAPFAAGNPAGIDYVLSNVTTAELIALPRTPTVHHALLSRADVQPMQRLEALEGLAKINKTDITTELLAAIRNADRGRGDSADTVILDLGLMLAAKPPDELKARRAELTKLADEAVRSRTRQVAYVAATGADGGLEQAWKEASDSPAKLADFLLAVPLMPPQLRAASHALVRPLIQRPPPEVLAGQDRTQQVLGRFVRVELPARGALSLAEVQVFSGGTNLATSGKASQSTSLNENTGADRAIDGNASGRFADRAMTHTSQNDRDPWWEVDLGGDAPIESIVIWNRTDGVLGKRLDRFTLTVRDSSGKTVYRKAGNPAPDTSVRFEISVDPVNAVRRAAIIALTAADAPGSVSTLAELLNDESVRAAAVHGLGRVPRGQWPREQAGPIARTILAFVSKLPPAVRSSDEVKEAISLGIEAAGLVGGEEGPRLRKQLRDLGVTVIVIRPVREQMLFDRNLFVVEAGKGVEIVLDNTDAMPHNLVIARPGSIEKVGAAAELMVADPNAFALGFVPKLAEVMHATKLLAAQQTDRLTFTAPGPGEYPFVCTFPGHWRRMYGVMLVVKDLETYEKSPITPKDPVTGQPLAPPPITSTPAPGSPAPGSGQHQH